MQQQRVPGREIEMNGRPFSGGMANGDPIMLRRAAGRLRDWLQHRRLPWHLAGLAILLCVPALWLGWQFDDDFHRAALKRPELPLIARSPAEVYAFIEGDAVANRQAVVMGFLPWWSHEKLRLAFFRPLTGLTLWLDYRAWPESPWLMHAHSLLWLGGVVLVAALYYRRIIATAWVAGLAALLFAVDDAHALPAAWIANRHATIAVFFGLLALIAHDRWRRGGWRVGVVLGPLAFLLGLLSSESAVATGAYLVAYAFCFERGASWKRAGALVPYVLIGAFWWLAYKAFGYGATGSGWYIDPAAEPARFAGAVATRAPLLLSWQWLVPSNLQWSISPRVAASVWMLVLGLLVALAAVLAPLVVRDRAARFWAVGSLLSLLPACAAYPSGRLLFFAGIGAMGLLAQLVAAVVENADRRPRRLWRRLPTGALCVALMFIHLVMAPLGLVRAAGSLKRTGRELAKAAASLPSDWAAIFQTTIIVSTPGFAVFSYSSLRRFLEGSPLRGRALVLGSGNQSIEIHRPDDRTLLFRPEAGFLGPAGRPEADCEAGQLLFDERRLLLAVDSLYRDDSPMAVSRQIGMLGVTADITSLTGDGRPAEVAFRFAMELENPHFSWLKWQDGVYVPFDPPTVGETVTLPAGEFPALERSPGTRLQH
jgi:hypothetical protein